MVETLGAGQSPGTLEHVDPDPACDLAIARAKVANLEIALVSGRRIGMALGILMARHSLSEQEALARLRTASQTRHVKVRDLAEHVIFTGTLDN